MLNLTQQNIKIHVMLIVLKRDYGQLGNRLHTHVNLVAWCVENKFNYINLSFKYLTTSFENKRFPAYKSINNIFLTILFKFAFIEIILEKFALSEKWLKRLDFFFHYQKCEDHTSIDEYRLNKLIKLDKRKIFVIKAWNLNCSDSLKKNGDIVKYIFRPNRLISNFIESYIRSLPYHDYTVGVHARRGDYKIWENGKYFYSWDQYSCWISELSNILTLKGKVPLFLICSDEKVPNFIKRENHCIIPNQNAIIELYLLANCDLIVGPPSSYGTWAQFYKNNKRICLKSKDENIENYL